MVIIAMVLIFVRLPERITKSRLD